MGLFKTAAKVAVASSVHGRVQRRQQARWAEQDRAPAVQAPAPAPPAPPDMRAKLDLLAQLGELRDAGVLTDSEFELQKAAILKG